MNSALNPVLTSTGPQNTQVTPQLNKPMHPQGAPATFGQPPSHMPQNLVNIPHNTNVAHSHPNAAQNHYSLNVPNSSQHYMGNSSIPPSNHPVANVGPGSAQVYNAPKAAPFSGGYQPNLGHPPNQQNALPPVSQTLPATTQAQQSVSQPSAPIPTETANEKPQSNGTTEAKSPTKVDPSPGNHVSPVKDKTPSPVPQVPQASLATEKPAEKPSTPAPAPIPVEQKPAQPAQELPKVAEESCAPRPAAVPASIQQSLSSPTKPSESPSKSTEPEKIETAVKAPASAVQTPEEKSTDKTDSGDSNSSEGSEKEAAVTGEAPSIENSSSETTTKSKEQSPAAKTSPTRQIATPRTPTRKSKTPKIEESESPKTPKLETKPSPQKLTTTGKLKRQRTRTQPYQSPLPELEIISKISSNTPRTKTGDDKLIVFYKNEFLAVRNSDGTFFVCQAIQNIYKSSSKIKIRWLSQDGDDKGGEIYTPDFYDFIDFDCILTNLNLTRVDKGKFRLPKTEKERTDSILNRSLAVEKGEEVHEESFTEEHPDGLDISLYKEESQISQKKKKATKRKASSSLKSDKKTETTKKSPEQAKVRKLAPKALKKKILKKTIAKPIVEVKKSSVSTPTTSSRAGRAAKRRSDSHTKTSPVVDQKKAKMLAKVARKTAVPVTTSKTKSALTVTTKISKTLKPLVTSTKSTKTPTAPPAKVAATRKTKRSTKK